MTKEDALEIARNLNKTATAKELGQKLGVTAAQVNSMATALRGRGVKIPTLKPKQMLLDAVVTELAAEGLVREVHK